MENATEATLTSVASQVGHAVNNRASQFATHSTGMEAAGLPVAAAFWIHGRTFVGIKEGIITMGEGNEGFRRY